MNKHEPGATLWHAYEMGRLSRLKGQLLNPFRTEPCFYLLLDVWENGFKEGLDAPEPMGLDREVIKEMKQAKKGLNAT